MENINVVGDLKIIRRHSVGSIIVGILCLLTIAVPVFYLFAPWSWFRYEVQASSSYYSSGSAMMNTMNLMKYLFTMKDEGIKFIIDLNHTSASIRDNSMNYYLTLENVYALAGWYLLMSLFAVILVILGLVMLIRGRLRSNKATVVLTFLFMLCAGMFLLDTWRLGYYTGYTFKQALNIVGESTDTNSYKYVFWQNYCFAGTAGGIFLLLAITYGFTLAKRLYKEDVDFVEDVEYSYRAQEHGGKVLNNVVNVGGHKYSQNTYVEKVTIADGVKNIGVGAFSNCLNLKVVQLPRTVKRIGSNAFFNCPKLRQVRYLGSKEDWLKVSRGSNWLAQSGTKSVVCNNGTYTVNPYK